MKYIVGLVFSFILLSNVSVLSQQSIEELQSQLEEAASDTTRIDLLEKISLSLMGSNPDEAISYAKEGVSCLVR